MVSSHAIPWYNRPARPSPAKEWLKTRYPLLVTIAPASHSARPADAPDGGRREFPAKVWLRTRQAGG